jgi:hypothetical protein
LDTYSSHGVIKKWEVATQLGLSKDDIGQVILNFLILIDIYLEKNKSILRE